jgi:chromosome segregation ATPase
MNMVIGPNGTGKSTVVCAIALGLGGKPDVSRTKKILGRSKDLADFVKHGTAASKIEIELKTDGSEENIVIVRKFGKSKHSKYQLNGKDATEAAVRSVVAKFNIQVDNLW